MRRVVALLYAPSALTPVDVWSMTVETAHGPVVVVNSAVASAPTNWAIRLVSRDAGGVRIRGFVADFDGSLAVVKPRTARGAIGAPGPGSQTLIVQGFVPVLREHDDTKFWAPLEWIENSPQVTPVPVHRVEFLSPNPDGWLNVAEVAGGMVGVRPYGMLNTQTSGASLPGLEGFSAYAGDFVEHADRDAAWFIPVYQGRTLRAKTASPMAPNQVTLDVASPAVIPTTSDPGKTADLANIEARLVLIHNGISNLQSLYERCATRDDIRDVLALVDGTAKTVNQSVSAVGEQTVVIQGAIADRSSVVTQIVRGVAISAAGAALANVLESK